MIKTREKKLQKFAFFLMMTIMASAALAAQQSIVSGVSYTAFQAWGAVSEVLRESYNPDCVYIFIIDKSSPVSLLEGALRDLSTGYNIALFETSFENGEDGTFVQPPELFKVISQILEKSKMTQMVLGTDDLDFLVNFVGSSVAEGALFWPTRLLIVTRLPQGELSLLQKEISVINAMVMSVRDSSMFSVKCGLYAVLPFSLRILQIASWTPAYGIVYHTKYRLFPNKFRRFLDGGHLTVLSLPLSPYMFLKNAPEGSNSQVKSTFYGPMKNLLDVLAKSVNFTYDLSQPPDGAFGYAFSNGTWNGMIGMVLRKEADMALGAFAPTYVRFKVIEFTYPLNEDNVRVMGRRGDTEVSPWSFVMPLTGSVWASTFVTLFVVLFTVIALSRVDIESRGTARISASTYIRIFLQQDMDDTSTHRWERLVLGFWLMFVFVVIASYKTNLMSLLAVRHISEPFQSHQDMVDDPSVIMLTFPNTAQVQFIAAAKSGIFYEVAKIGKQGRIKYIPISKYVTESNRLVSQGDHVLSIPYLMLKRFLTEDYMDKGRCKFYASRDGYIQTHVSWVVQKKSPISEAINRGIRASAEGGFYEYWLDNAIPNVRSCRNPPTKITVKATLSLTNLWGMFVVLLCGCLIGFFILLLEVIWSTLHK